MLEKRGLKCQNNSLRIEYLETRLRLTSTKKTRKRGFTNYFQSAPEQNDKDMTDGKDGQMTLIFNYNNVFYSFYYDALGGCVHRSREYAVNYVYSGEMVLDNGTEQVHVGKGECVFIPRDHHNVQESQGRGTVLRHLPHVYKTLPEGDVRQAGAA